MTVMWMMFLIFFFYLSNWGSESALRSAQIKEDPIFNILYEEDDWGIYSVFLNSDK